MKISGKYLTKLHTAYMNLGFRYKTLVIFNSIIILVSIILGTYSYVTSSKMIQANVTSTNLRDIEQITNSMDFLQKDIYDLSTFICINPTVQSFLRARNNLQSQLVGNNLESFNNLLASKDYISFIVIYNKNGDTYYISSDRSTGIKSYDSVKQSRLYEKVRALKGAPVWVDLNAENQVFIIDNKAPKIAMVRALLDNNTFEASGLLAICVNHNVLRRIYASNSKLSGDTMILDQDNRMITSSRPMDLDSTGYYTPDMLTHLKNSGGSTVFRNKGKKLLIVHNTMKQSGWKVVSVTPVDVLLNELNSILGLTVVVIMICLAIAFMFSAYTSSVLTLPVKQLLNSMEKVKNGDFKEKVDFKYNDEIGMLGVQYNDMVDKINNLIGKVYKLQIKEREAELKALQAQINPHFLYNTLDTIFWKAEKSKQKDISEMVYALSRLFRTTLNKGSEFILVKEEKEFIEHYLLLQSSRFRERLTYDIDFDPLIMDYSIPKLIFQPFVENSIIHGMEAYDRTCHIRISGIFASDRLLFTIEDNGAGIDQDTISRLLDKAVHDEKGFPTRQGYAISNVDQRLALYYDGDYEIKITGSPGEGTKVEIMIPKVYRAIV
ncbi:MAG TPA: sensor histidine kinase [Clostridia bacterium]|nr:sensor histidine kinase [Clostridia bacterium]